MYQKDFLVYGWKWSMGKLDGISGGVRWRYIHLRIDKRISRHLEMYIIRLSRFQARSSNVCRAP